MNKQALQFARALTPASIAKELCFCISLMSLQTAPLPHKYSNTGESFQGQRLREKRALSRKQARQKGNKNLALIFPDVKQAYMPNLHEQKQKHF